MPYLLFIDIAVIFLYLTIREIMLNTLLNSFNYLTGSRLTEYDFLVWGGFLFFVCVGSSLYRNKVIPLPINKRGLAVAFELTVVVAAGIMVISAINFSERIDPWWIVRLNYFQYIYEVATTVGVAYIFSDLLIRLNNLKAKDTK